MELKHTPGPWRWEFNKRFKSISLVGGIPKFDKVVMDFARWGLSGAVPLFNSAITGNQHNIMVRVCDMPDWLAPFEGRAHHQDWCMAVTHPDARLIAAAPEMLEALLMWERIDALAYTQDFASDIEMYNAAMKATKAAISAATVQ